LGAPHPLARELLVRWLELIYEGVYGKPASDPRLVRMIAQLGDPVQLE
jgi:hypothetical protein